MKKEICDLRQRQSLFCWRSLGTGRDECKSFRGTIGRGIQIVAAPPRRVVVNQVAATEEIAEIDKTQLCSSSCGVVDTNAPSEVHEVPLASVGFGYVPREKGERIRFTL